MDSAGLEIVLSLPLPLAQTFRRAVNAKSAESRHSAAYYFFESTLKLSAAGQVGAYLDMGCHNDEINRLLESITRPAVGHWLAILRDVSSFQARRADPALAPLAGVGERLRQREELPASRLWFKAIKKHGLLGTYGGEKRPCVLDVFNAIVSYRNKTSGHGGQRHQTFYAQVAPLLLEAVLECLNALRPLESLQLVVARDIIEPGQGAAIRRYDILGGDGIHRPLDYSPSDRELIEIPAGRLLLAGHERMLALHPLVIYQSVRDRDRFGFLNRVRTRGKTGKRAVFSAEYLDYDSGELLHTEDSVLDLTRLFSRIRGESVSDADLLGDVHDDSEREGPEVALGGVELLGELGRGGMGVVYKGRQVAMDRLVALKVISPALVDDAMALKRFQREIFALARCDHPNLVRILNAGTDDGQSFYVMEFVDGPDLWKVFKVLALWKDEGIELREGHLKAAIASIQGSGGGKERNRPIRHAL